MNKQNVKGIQNRKKVYLISVGNIVMYFYRFTGRGQK